MTIDEAFTIDDRDVTLSGLLADGSAFSFDLNSDNAPNGVVPTEDFFSSSATLTVTLVSPVLRGDCNLDGAVDFFDINPFVGVLLTRSFLEEADINRDGGVNFLDIAPFIEVLSGS